ncbi:MAG: sigma-70 family RNA polymerase sigma factor [Planctomycetota bacterium]
MVERSLRMRLDGVEQERRDLVAAQGGDRQAFGRLVERHFGPLYGLLYRLAGNPEDAEDLCQEAFVRAWSALPNLRPESRLAPYLAQVGLHLFYDQLRARGRRPSGVRLDPLIDGGPADEHTPLESLQGREADQLLAEALERLPERLRTALVLRVIEGRDYEEIAEITGNTVTTLRTQVHQARRMLLRLLAPWLEGEDA